MFVRFATTNDYVGIINLDKKVFPADWIVPYSFVEGVLAKNDYTYRVLEDNGEIKGFYCFFPLLNEDFENLLNGKIEEKYLPNYIVDYNTPKDVYLYIATVNVDIHSKNRKEYIKTLLADIPTYATFLKEKEITVKELGAIAITKVGYRFSKHSGLTPAGKLGDDVVFRGKIEDLLL